MSTSESTVFIESLLNFQARAHQDAYRILEDRDLASEAVSESIARAYAARDSFNSDKGTLWAWFGRIVRNESNRLLEQTIKESTALAYLETMASDGIDVDGLGERAPSAEEEALAGMGLDALISGLNVQLSPRLAGVFYLRAVEECSHETIALLLGISPAVSRKRFERAREIMQEKCSEYSNNGHNVTQLTKISA